MVMVKRLIKISPLHSIKKVVIIFFRPSFYWNASKGVISSRYQHEPHCRVELKNMFIFSMLLKGETGCKQTIWLGTCSEACRDHCGCARWIQEQAFTSSEGKASSNGIRNSRRGCNVQGTAHPGNAPLLSRAHERRHTNFSCFVCGILVSATPMPSHCNYREHLRVLSRRPGLWFWVFDSELHRIWADLNASHSWTLWPICSGSVTAGSDFTFRAFNRQGMAIDFPLLN